MKVGLVSDSHGELENLKRAARLIMEKGHAHVIVHLGDNYDDAAVLHSTGARIIKVPGTYCRQYADPSINKRMLVDFEGWRTLITHTPVSNPNDLPSDIRPEELMRNGEMRVMLYGHTHIPKAIDHVGFIFINPGHIKAGDNDDKPSFALLDFRPDSLEVKIIDLKTGRLVENKTFNKCAGLHRE
jgi:hypothetical protein